MKKPILIFMLLYFVSITYAQVGIGTTTPQSSSMLDVESTNKGVLLPRMTNSQKNSISNPATGLMVYDITNKCTSVNIGTPASPNWECLNKTDNATIPTVIISDSSLKLSETLNFNQWVNVPDLNTTFTILEDEYIKISWTLFSGQTNSIDEDGFAQMFTILEVNGVKDDSSSNYLPMVHNTGETGSSYLMNTSTFTHAMNLSAGTYTIRVKVYLSAFMGSTDEVELGSRINYWSGRSGLTNQQMLNSTSNKLLITFL
ncbi:hypothetical protein QLS71_018155 [Mariniflexile litorale]|uniref:Uncharacterized protein n=1 Tax=Mariniflexile litorale TaxID=3045158 RepID=A0AAU7EF27_9FLAO|nr:hypothetical protein [Mariniflexile sp. KMM 9835]MDQ8213192.1 hypothetical protein [Mariniflexile sp. KMM 9835]